MPKTLYRYLLKQNVYYLGIILASGVSVYLLIDFLDRVDNFISAGLGAGMVFRYYIYKLPLIVSQILPAVFLLSVVLQLGIMIRNREFLALRSNSISIWALVWFFVVYALLWGGAQLLFSQVLGTKGMQKTEYMWEEKVEKENLSNRSLRNIWFKEGNLFVHLQRVTPGKGRGRGVQIYKITGGEMVSSILRAKELVAKDNSWELKEVEKIYPQTHKRASQKRMKLEMNTDLQNFLRVDSEISPQSMSLFELGDLIHKLKEKGSNVERLRTVWHSKFAYAASIVVMALIGLALVTLSGNIYFLVLLSLVMVFVYYVGYVAGMGMGEGGSVSPIAGAWAPNVFLGFAALATLVYKTD